MKSIKKILALFLLVLMCLSVCACDKTPRTLTAQWGFKAGGTEYPVGTYIFPLVNAYNYAYSYLEYELGDDFDPDASILDLQSSFDEAGKLYTAREYILKQAEDYIKYMIAIDSVSAQKGAEPSQEAVLNATEQAKIDWYLGDINGEMSGYAQADPAKDTYEEYGVSYESYYQAVYLSGRKGIKHDAIFSRLYGKGGEKAVSDEEITEHFKKDYTAYYYFVAALYETETDEVTGEQINTPLSEKETQKVKKELQSYVEMAKEGKPMSSIEAEYMEYANVTSDAIYFRIERYEDASVSVAEEIAEALRGMDEKQAQVLYLGLEETPIAVFVYKDSIADKAKDIVGNDTDRMTLMRDLKDTEYSDYLVSKAEEVNFEMNEEVLRKFTPEYVEKIYKSNL